MSPGEVKSRAGRRLKAVGTNMKCVRVWADGGKHLVPGVVTGHVTFPTVDAHLRIDRSLQLLLDIELVIGANAFQSFCY